MGSGKGKEGTGREGNGKGLAHGVIVVLFQERTQDIRPVASPHWSRSSCNAIPSYSLGSLNYHGSRKIPENKLNT